MSAGARVTAFWLSAALFLAGAAPAAAPPAAPPSPAPRPACAPLRIEPPEVRVAVGSALLLHAAGGAGPTVFSLEGDAAGARLEPGGGLRAGGRAARFSVVARDACGAEARAPVEVLGPFEVRPAAIGLPRGGSVTFEATGALGAVSYRVIDSPRGSEASTVDAAGAFHAGDAEGVYQLVARDEGSGREARLTVTVGKVDKLRPAAPVIALPAGARARLSWLGGSGAVVPSRVTAGAVVAEGAALFFDARAARPGAADVVVTDRFTRETASVRVLIGEALGAPPVARGAQTQLGDLASGDVNGDGLGDLIIGHAERSRVEAEAGGLLVAYGKPDGALAKPAVAVEGSRAQDHRGAVLLVADMNGDGIDDVVSGVPEENLGENDRGAVAIYLGSKGGLEATPDRVLVGENVNQRFGSALVAADLTGDGAPELVTSAPQAKSPFAPGCEGGRVYVFRNLGRARGAIAPMPLQVIDLRAPLSDAAVAPLPCSGTPLGAGRALAILDMDGDKALDLVVGAPLASFPTPGRSHGAVLVYRGAQGGKFEEHPSFAIHLDPSIRADNAGFGAALDVVRASPRGPAALVVRAPSFSPKGPRGAPLASAGGLWVFAQGSLGAPPPKGPSSAPQVRVVTTSAARARYDGTVPHRGVGRSASLGDVDPRPGLEYLVSAAAPGVAGEVAVFSAAQILEARGALTPFAQLTSTAGDELAFARVAAVRGRPGESDGLAAWAPWRTTPVGPFVGAIDWAKPGTAPLAARFQARAAMALENFGAGDRAGSAVALAALDKGAPPAAIVGVPLAHSPSAAGHPAGERLRTGTVDVFREDPSTPAARLWVDRNEARIGGSVVPLDFDGDGSLDLAVADPSEGAGGPAPSGAVDPAGCSAVDPKSNSPTNVAGRGVVRIYSQVNGALVERFRVTAPRETGREGYPRFFANRTGAALAAADVNGDGKGDLVIGRPGGRDTTGAEVVLGRAPDPSGKVLIACNTGEAGPVGAVVLPPISERSPLHYGAAVARVGDVDRDGCDEVAFSIRSAGFPGPARAGVLVAFGYDASGARCRGHRAPFLLHLVPDDRPLASNAEGDASARADDAVDLRGAPTGMGAALPRGSGDVTGDGVPDLVFRDLDLARGALRGPAVEIISGAYLGRLCPNHACRGGLRGPLFSDKEWHVLALRALAAPERTVLVSDDVARGFGASLALGDLTGDGIAELAVGSDGAGDSAFGGEVRVFRGGPSLLASDGALPEPWLLAAGDPAERSGFGASIALAPGDAAAFMLLGAPQSSRAGAGGAVGAAYRFRVEVPR